MQTEPQITFRGIDPSPALTELIDKKLAMLERSYDRITSCRVTVEKRDRHGRQGHLYKVAVEMEVPGGEIIVNRKPGDLGAHENVRVAIRDSFDAARRQLDEHVRKIGRVQVKEHPEKCHGTVVRLFPNEGYGFIRTAGGDEVYFHRDSVQRNDWERLDLDRELVFSLMDGDKGPFAADVSLRD